MALASVRLPNAPIERTILTQCGASGRKGPPAAPRGLARRVSHAGVFAGGREQWVQLNHVR